MLLSLISKRYVPALLSEISNKPLEPTISVAEPSLATSDQIMVYPAVGVIESIPIDPSCPQVSSITSYSTSRFVEATVKSSVKSQPFAEVTCTRYIPSSRFSIS